MRTLDDLEMPDWHCNDGSPGGRRPKPVLSVERFKFRWAAQGTGAATTAQRTRSSLAPCGQPGGGAGSRVRLSGAARGCARRSRRRHAPRTSVGAPHMGCSIGDVLVSVGCSAELSPPVRQAAVWGRQGRPLTSRPAEDSKGRPCKLPLQAAPPCPSQAWEDLQGANQPCWLITRTRQGAVAVFCCCMVTSKV